MHKNSSMQSEQMGKPLMNTTVLQVQANFKEQQCAFIQRYNQVITCYNRFIQEGQPIMQVMVGNSFILTISKNLNKTINFFFLFLILLFLPGLNIFCLICLFIYMFYLKRQNKKHKRNIERVNDPFQNFYYMPEMCEHMGKHYATLNLSLNQLQGFTFNEELRQKLSAKLKQKITNKMECSSLTVLIYDQHFYDSFYLYRKEFFKTIILTIGGVICVALSFLLYSSIFDLI